MSHSTLQLNLLGGFSAYLNDNAFINFRSDKIRALLTYLAVEANRSHRREVLATLFWEEMTDSVAKRNLRQSLYRLKQSVGLPDGWLVMTRQTVMLDGACVQSDIGRFQHLIQTNQLAEAVKLYQGEFLQGLTLKDSNGFTEWQVIQREAAHQQMVLALYTLAENYLAAQDYERAQAMAQRQLTLEAWSEGAHRQAMRAYAQSGQRTLALAQFERCREILQRELGVGVSAETALLLQQIQQPNNRAARLTSAELLRTNVHKTWIEGFLKESVADPIPLSWTTTPAHVNGSLSEVFESAEEFLLILGEAGSGKTATLLTLVKTLLDAEVAWIPVVLNLSSWDSSADNLTDWLTRQIKRHYHQPPKQTQAWLTAQQLGLFLDGLDEVPATCQADCIAAINQFHAVQPSTPIVVAVRSGVYTQQTTPLDVNATLTLQPLAISQITQRLSQHDPDFLSLIETDETLRELLRSPLLLNLIASLDRPNLESADLQNMRQQVFRLYVNRQLQDDGELIRPLKFLAQSLLQQSQTIFQFEQLQPNWLPEKWQRLLYLLLTRLPIGLLLGVCEGLYTEIGRRRMPNFEVEVYVQLGAQLPNWIPAPEFWAAVLWVWSMAIPLVLFDWYWYERKQAGHPTTAYESWLVAGTLFLYPFLTAIAFGNTPFVAAFGSGHLVAGYLLISGFRRKQGGYHNDITTIETASWSWRSAAQGLALGIPISTIGSWLLSGNFSEVTSLSLLTMLVMGFRSQPLADKAAFNQGIHLTALNSLRIGLLSAVISAFLFVDNSSVLSILAGLCFALLTMTAFGGYQVFKHYVLRGCLIWFDLLPRDLVAFAQRGINGRILRRVGGGVTFVHRLLQEYIARHSR